jgi:hypothetical protein
MEQIANETNREPEYFSACHYDGDSKMAMVSSWDEDVQYSRTEEQVREEILKKRSTIDESQAILMGHSYGGWVVMSMGAQLTASQAFGQLYTVDPISKINCSIRHPLGCQSAPEDIGAADRVRIANKTTAWHNYYQTNTAHLHSSSISQADTNSLSERIHREVDTDPMVWRDVRNGVRESLEY